MTRRFIAALCIVGLLTLTVTLLWRVYVHHTQTVPNEKDEPVIVSAQPRAA